MKWTSAADLTQQVLRLWQRGDLLRPLVTEEAWEPRRLILKGPDTAQMSAYFDSVRAWVAQLITIDGIRIQWREVNHRVVGAQRLPASIWVDSLEDAIALIGKEGEAMRFKALLELTRQRQPLLVDWMGSQPLQAIELEWQWAALLDVVTWMTQHPRPGIYLRQVDIPGIHSKFIERHKAVLSELFDQVLPELAIGPQHKGATRFSARYGFLDKPVGIRLRVLDPSLTLLPGPMLPDITLDAASFAQLNIAVRQVFVTENETNFLAFPLVPDSIVVFGKGYGWDALGQANWLSNCTIYYWGDIDTHGFAILDQLRRRFGHVESLLMDRGTLDAHAQYWGREDRQVVYDLPYLTSEERSVFDELRDNRLGDGVRLEQEYVGYRCLMAALKQLSGISGEFEPSN
ncbi:MULTISPECIES: DUF3322 domain-containing protein [unclassified Pseudomonas]|uniref:DUF3322 domain-containing protein n=1 Tax=unclassified Pseudomonas TaxID=196821 RepID=UPI0015A1474A|nr:MULTISPECIES: Wadjet anti-phage system protein JetD domain-containing protein [unclassified Pseudomonas]NWC94166.1 hypothetical protein [Pseudomonas sp. IPO3779]NWD20868.1 hypothetical protein [Pseudomonas sp. IPO3778]